MCIIGILQRFLFLNFLLAVVLFVACSPLSTPSAPSAPTPVPTDSCEEMDQDSGVGYWIQQMAVADPRTGGTTICVINGSRATGSLLFAKEVISGRSLESRHLWNVNPTRLQGVPYVGVGPNGFTLFIQVRVFYSDGSFTITHGLLLSEELPTPSTN